jgi:hypothetical protein
LFGGEVAQCLYLVLVPAAAGISRLLNVMMSPRLASFKRVCSGNFWCDGDSIGVTSVRYMASETSVAEETTKGERVAALLGKHANATYCEVIANLD